MYQDTVQSFDLHAIPHIRYIIYSLHSTIHSNSSTIARAERKREDRVLAWGKVQSAVTRDPLGLCSELINNPDEMDA